MQFGISIFGTMCSSMVGESRDVQHNLLAHQLATVSRLPRLVDESANNSSLFGVELVD